VRKLEIDRLIEAVAHERVARGGMRTIYRITAEGRAEFQRGLLQQLEVEGPVSHTLYGALLFLHLAEEDAVEGALRRRLARLDELIDKLDPIRTALAQVLSTGGDHLMRHLDRQRRLDREWTKELLAEIEAKGIRDVTDASKLGPKS
jgi:DNA-binding PadR family transcriptional regulator